MNFNIILNKIFKSLKNEDEQCWQNTIIGKINRIKLLKPKYLLIWTTTTKYKVPIRIV